jgi:DNA topoisomerase-1
MSGYALMPKVICKRPGATIKDESSIATTPSGALFATKQNTVDSSFAQVLPRIRQQVRRHLALPGLPRDKVLATVVHLLDTTHIRIGNIEYARTNQSYGLTTVRDRHVEIRGATLWFRFWGKSGKDHSVVVNDRRLASIVRRCQELPGYELFQYVDPQGQSQTIASGDVNDYLRTVSGQNYTAKDFRTWAGTLLAVRALLACGACTSQRYIKQHIVRAVTLVAEQLGNTVAVCRKHLGISFVV